PEIETRLPDWCRGGKVMYAVTQLSAAWRYSPFVRHDKSVIYYFDGQLGSEARRSGVLRPIDATQVAPGAKCTLWMTDDPSVFVGAREFEGVTVVSPLQLYLDLKSLGGRGEDAAEEILEKELRPLFRAARLDDEPTTEGNE